MSVSRFFDAHCHLQDPRIGSKLHSFIENAINKGVKYMVVNGTCEEDWEKVLNLSQSYPQIIPSFGLHPWYVKNRSPNWFCQLRDLLLQHPESAIGEIGLDKSKKYSSSIDDQIEVFKDQLSLSKELNRPVAIHCVKAYGKLNEILKENEFFGPGIILHSFGGSPEMISSFLNLNSNLFFSFSCRNISNPSFSSVLNKITVEKLLAETDSPDSFPFLSFSENGKNDSDNSNGKNQENENPLNSPENVTKVVEAIAKNLGISESEISETIFKNSINVFSFDGSKISNS